MDPEEQRQSVSKYYSSTLSSTTDLKTSACCPIDSVPESHRPIIANLHPEVTSRFYGCGSPIPSHLKGCTVLDLGCGTGRDVYLSSALVGQHGSVVGVDMTPEQLEIANRHRQYHATKFYGPDAQSNVQFRRGFIEDLRSANIEDASVDIVISNCVCNLSPDKKAVFSEVSRVLKQGGEFYFSDVYADRRLTKEAASHEVLVGECLGGALYVQDFHTIMSQVGFPDVRVVSAAPIDLRDPELRKLVPDVTFYSLTIRAFKIEALEATREDYGQSATFVSCGGGLKFDIDNDFRKGAQTPIDANTAAILQQSRYKRLFTVTERTEHRGSFKRPQESSSDIVDIRCFRALPLPGLSEKASNGVCGVPTPLVSDVSGAKVSSAVKGTSCCPSPDASILASAAPKNDTVSCSGGGVAVTEGIDKSGVRKDTSCCLSDLQGGEADKEKEANGTEKVSCKAGAEGKEVKSSTCCPSSEGCC
ncbi:A Chain A Arsm Arsenic(Iii) S-Adenosylmethionine Methyltransferase With Sam [Gracilaria domingensis]|nr:A Chain A Arsm Arsenic(Iii) S-Adenosylmethionine Methyltransferase With Sam [Gracilaria domingensis]